MKLKLNIVLLFIALSAMVVGCKNDSEESSEATTDEGALQQLVLEDLEIEDVDAWSGDDNLAGGGGLDETINPVRWGRVGRRARQSVDVAIQGDTLATITTTTTFNGEFRIGAQVDDTTWHYYAKPMYNTIVRKAHAVRIDRSPRPRHNWRISEITPIVLNSADPNPHTIEPTQVEIYRNVGEGLELVASITDPLNTYFDRQNLPWANPEQELEIYVHANTTDPAVAVLHPHVYRNGHHPRLMLLDDGVYPDAVAADGIYSGTYVTGVHAGVFMSGFDLLNYETLYDSEGAYNAGGWALPYRVVGE
jgi:hypothetical protein